MGSAIEQIMLVQLYIIAYNQHSIIAMAVEVSRSRSRSSHRSGTSEHQQREPGIKED